LVAAAFRLEFSLVLSELLLAELGDVLTRPRIAARVAPHQASAYIEAIEGVAVLVEDPVDRPAATRDPDDDFIVALAIATSVDCIVSGDQDLPQAQAMAMSIRVMTPSAFLAELRHTP